MSKGISRGQPDVSEPQVFVLCLDTGNSQGAASVQETNAPKSLGARRYLHWGRGGGASAFLLQRPTSQEAALWLGDEEATPFTAGLKSPRA